MLRKVKYSKIAIVIFLTILIWVYADLAQDEELPVSNATITVAKSHPSLWVSFNGEPSASIGGIVLKGPASKISDIRQRVRDGSLYFEFFLDAGQEGMVEPGEYTLDLLDFLRKSDMIRGFGLTAESCKPTKLTVNVIQLVEKSLTVQCFDEGGNSQEAERIDPREAKMFVPEDWGRDKLIAQVTLTPGEIEQARLAPIAKTPHIVLGTSQIREAASAVEIKMPPEERLTEYTIERATLFVAPSPNLQGQYSCKVTNLPQVLRPIYIRATDVARRAYQLQRRPQMTLYIYDDDTDKGQEEQSRAVVYNFPEEFVRRNEIELKNPQQPAEAKFVLVPLSSAGGP